MSRTQTFSQYIYSSTSSSSIAPSSIQTGSLYSSFNLIQFTPTPPKVIRKYDLFQFKEELNATPWNVSSPLDLTPTNTPFPSLEDETSKCIF